MKTTNFFQGVFLRGGGQKLTIQEKKNIFINDICTKF